MRASLSSPPVDIKQENRSQLLGRRLFKTQTCHLCLVWVKDMYIPRCEEGQNGGGGGKANEGGGTAGIGICIQGGGGGRKGIEGGKKGIGGGG